MEEVCLLLACEVFQNINASKAASLNLGLHRAAAAAVGSLLKELSRTNRAAVSNHEMRREQSRGEVKLRRKS